MTGPALIVIGALLTAWASMVTWANLRPAPELTGLHMVDTKTAIWTRRRPEEIAESADVTLMHVD